MMHVTPERPPGPAPGDETKSKRDVRVLYRGDQVIVTDDWLAVWGRRYPVRELKHLRVVRGPHSDLTINATLVAIALAVGIARLWDRLDASGWVGALLVLAVPVLLAALGIRLRRRSHLLLAEYRGRTVVLVGGPRREQINQVARAVLRAAHETQATI
jgi:hypothetical protein